MLSGVMLNISCKHITLYFIYFVLLNHNSTEDGNFYNFIDHKDKTLIYTLLFAVYIVHY
jgi:hypothetical protein